MMNRLIAMPVITILVVGVGVLGFLYFNESSKLNDAESEISSLEGSVSSLQSTLTNKDAEILSLEDDLDTANTSLQAQQEINATLTEELEKVTDPRHFSTLSELVDWLDQDATDVLYGYEDLYELAFILQVSALRDGFILPACFEDLDSDYFIDNIGNIAYIGDEIYMVWPEDDTVFVWAYVPPIPSHPLPLD
jgi:hypothetical protein